LGLRFDTDGVYIVSAYVNSLHEHKQREMYLQRQSFESGVTQPYDPVATSEESHPLTHPPHAPGYAYADKSHSFGGDHAAQI
jgi:hypothetical protein